MPNRTNYLGAAILAELELRGPMTLPWLANNLNEKPRAIAASCVTLARNSKIRSWKSGILYRTPYGKKVAEVYWEIGPSDFPPPKPVRKRKPLENSGRMVGIDETDLAWMEKYRQQAAKRRAQKMQVTSCPC